MKKDIIKKNWIKTRKRSEIVFHPYNSMKEKHIVFSDVDD